MMGNPNPPSRLPNMAPGRLEDARVHVCTCRYNTRLVFLGYYDPSVKFPPSYVASHVRSKLVGASEIWWSFYP